MRRSLKFDLQQGKDRFRSTKVKYFQLKTVESSVEGEVTSDIFGWCLILSEVEPKV